MSLLATAILAAEGGPAHSPRSWLPENAEVIWGTIAFIVVAYVIVKFGGPAIKNGLKARSERIQKQLDDAAAAKTEADRAAQQITANLGNLAADRQRIMAEATASAEQLKVDGRARNDAEVAELEAKAEADLALARTRVGNELQAHVAELSNEAAERVVRRQLDDATLQDLVEQFIARVGSTNGSKA